MPNPIRNRRLLVASAFTPPEWGSLQLWLSADSGTFTDTGLTTPATADGTAIGGWRDRGPFGHNATQATGARQPVLKTGGLNGHPTILFASASSQWISVDSIAAAFSGSSLPLTLIVVLKPVSTATGVYLGLAAAASPSTRWFFDNSTTNWSSVKTSDAGSSTTVTAATGGVDTNAHIVTWVSPGTTMQINMDGINQVGPNSQTLAPTTFNNADIGAVSINGTASTFVNSNIAELFAWSTMLSAGEQAYVRAAMAKKYGILST